MKYILAFIALGSIIWTNTTQAQPLKDQQLQDRIDRLERHLNTLERAYYRKSRYVDLEPAGVGEQSAEKANTSIETRLSDLEQQLRSLTNKITELENALGTNAAKLQPASQKTVTSQPHSSIKPASKKPQYATPGAIPASMRGKRPQIASADPTPTTIADPITKPVQAVEPIVDTTKSEYDEAFALLRQGKYDDASTAFQDFVNKHPSTQLTGNAYYWLGETYFVRGDYENASKYFQQGYGIAPTGRKAADNLLKLGMALGHDGKKSRACTIFEKLADEFPQAPIAIQQRLTRESNRFTCG